MTVSGQAFEDTRETIRAAGSPVSIDLGVTPYEVSEPGPVDFVYVTDSEGNQVVDSEDNPVVTTP